MLEGIARQRHAQSVVRLASCGPSVEADLAALGVAPDNVAEATAELHARGVRSDLNQFLDRPFEPRGYVSRFSDGATGVFYSANERPTAVAEVAYHCLTALAGADLDRRVFFHHIVCDFDGSILDLRLHVANPHLIHLANPDEAAAYPACQAIAAEARLIPIDALLTPSARNAAGTCIPIWERASLGNVQIIATVALSRNATGAVVVEPA